jgi:hypothetical protein
MLAHPYFFPKPVFYKIIDNFRGTSANYKLTLRTIIKELIEKFSITVSGITCDNLKAQVNAIAGKTSFQSTEPPGNLKGVIRMSCVCHTLSLAIHDVSISSNFPKCFNANHEISLLMRKKPFRSYLKVVCPGWCKTRWTNAFDNGVWMLIHSQNLINLRTKCPFFLFKEFSSHLTTFDYLLFESIPLTLLSLLPISDLIKFIEQDQSPAAHICHLLQYAKLQNEIFKGKQKKYSLG